MKKNSNLLLNKLFLFLLLTGIGFNALCQVQGQPPFSFKLGGNASSQQSEKLGLKSNSDLSLITADTTRMVITKEGDVKLKKDIVLEKFQGQHSESRPVEITPDGVLRPIGNSTQDLNLYWKTNGNGSISSQHFLGTINNEDLRFRTYNSEKMILTREGLLGIATQAPERKLHIKSYYNYISEPPSPCPNPPCDPSPLNVPIESIELPIIRFEQFQGDQNYNNWSKWDLGGSTDFFINKVTDFQTEEYQRTFTIRNNGNVGIGLETPQYKLDVNGNINATGLLINGEVISNYWKINNDKVYYNGFVGIGTSLPTAGLHIKVDAGALNLEGNNRVFMQFFPNGMASGRKGWIGYGSAGDKDLTISNENVNGKINITSPLAHFTGNVGIGAIPEAIYNLKISGVTRACRIEIEANSWCDYVFEPDYKLMPIEDFSKYINTNKHLPGMPSEKELKESGIDIFEMFKMQQKIIEEYGLYIQQLNEKIEALKIK